jgi:predicted nucleotidyltransferase
MIQNVTPEQINLLCEQIAREFKPERIVLFGSHAYGTPGPFSDVDLMVVMPFEGSPLQQAAKILTRINPTMALDLIVRTPQQVTDRLAMKDGFMQQIVQHGKVTYEAQHTGMD